MNEKLERLAAWINRQDEFSARVVDNAVEITAHYCLVAIGGGVAAVYQDETFLVRTWEEAWELLDY